MEIEKPVIQPTENLLKCYRHLDFSPSQQNNSEANAAIIFGNTKSDNNDGNDSDNDLYDDMRGQHDIKSLLLVKKEAVGDKNSEPSTVASKQHHFATYQETQKTMDTARSDLNCSEFPSFQHRFSPANSDIASRKYPFVAPELLHNSSDSGINSNSEYSIQDETLELDSENLFETRENLSSSSLSRCFNHGRSASSITTAALASLFDPETNDLAGNGNNTEESRKSKHNDNRNFHGNCVTLEEKRPRIERPRARYPNSARRTSAPACLWSATSLFSVQVDLILFMYPLIRHLIADSY